MMRKYLNDAFCQQAFEGLKEICSFGEVLKFHAPTRFQSVHSGFGMNDDRYDFYTNQAYLDEHCERISNIMVRTGTFSARSGSDYGDFLVKGKDICLTISGCIELVVDKNTVTEADINEVLQHFYTPIDEDKAQIFILLKNQHYGYYAQRRSLDKLEVDIENSYGDGFVKFHEHVVQSLESRNGLVLLHGAPGTGKTTYIKHLSALVDRDFIFIPEILSEIIGSPDLLPILLGLDRPVIIIEDAEKMLISRETNVNNLVSSILNLSNGIFGDLLGASVICTFNTDLQNVDRALLREGRLIGNWEFTALDVERCRKVAVQQGIQLNIDKPMTVSEVVNYKSIISNTPVMAN